MRTDNEAVIMKQISERLTREAPRVDEPSTEVGVEGFSDGAEGLFVGELSDDVLS